jgi:hypothetical protein
VIPSKHARVAAVLSLGVFCGFSLFFSSGIVGVTKKPNHIFVNPGCFCHGDTTSPGVHVWLEGPDSVEAGEEALFTIFVARDSNIAAGFNVASFFGSLGIVDSVDTQLLPVENDSLELTHTQPKPANGRDTISWPFHYRAPATVGLVDTLYANGNSVDLSFDPFGDHWNFAGERLVHVIPTTAVENAPVAQEFQLRQNYPNPFNPTTTVEFRIPGSGSVRLAIFDLLGREVTTLVNERKERGTYSAVWNGEDGDGSRVSSGVYLYRLTVKPLNGHGYNTVETKKMILLQ